MIPGLFTSWGGFVASVPSGTTGFDVAAAFGNPSGPINYRLYVPLATVVGNAAPSPTLDASGLDSGSIGNWFIDGKVLGGGGDGFNGGIEIGPELGGGGGAGGGAGYPAGTGGAAAGGGDGLDTAGTSGSDTSTGSTTGGTAGVSHFRFTNLYAYWDSADYGKTPTEAAALDMPQIVSGGDAIRISHPVNITLGASARVWGGGAAGWPGYNIPGGAEGYNSEASPGGDVGDNSPDGFGVTAEQRMIPGVGGSAVKYSLLGAATFLGANTGDPFVKGAVS